MSSTISQTIGYWIIALIILGFIALTGYEITTWQNTFGIGRLVLPAAALGAVVGLVAGWWWGRTRFDSIDRLRVMVAGFFGGMLMALTGSSLLNRWGASPQTEIPVEFVRMEIYGASRFGQWQDSLVADGYYLYFRDPVVQDTKRIRLDYPWPGPPDPGDRIFLPVRHGLFGVDLVDLK